MRSGTWFTSTDVYKRQDFTTLAGKTITQLTAQGKLPLVVGGTGLYITSLLNGIGFTPEKDVYKRQAMQTDPRYLELDAARRENDNDQELQGLIGEFNLKRLDLNLSLIHI